MKPAMHDSPLPATASGSFRIGADLEVSRLGFGAMRITGRGVWGEPADRAEVLRTLRRLPELGIDFIDTADSYGPDVSEQLLREALHPYAGRVIATKGGLLRNGPDRWVPCGRPEYLLQQVKMSLRHLGLERIDLWQLHRIDPKVPADEQFGAIKAMQQEGLIRHAGLSEVSVSDIVAAGRHFTVATVQNRYNLVDRGSEAVLEHCTRQGIGFIPWYPLAAGSLANPGGAVEQVAKRHGATPGQVAIAWLLARSPVVLPIPGTSKVKHLEENTAAAALRLTQEECAELDRAGHSAAR
jgi:pyridoxine 4-dehydrogenase